jgi:hypothetical protein
MYINKHNQGLKGNIERTTIKAETIIGMYSIH